jgi:hypothetical protein
LKGWDFLKKSFYKSNYLDTQTREGQNKRRKLQVNIPNEYGCKNHQQNTIRTKSNITLKGLSFRLEK